MHGAALAGGDVVWSVDEAAAEAGDAQIFYALPTPDAHHVASQANRCRPGECKVHGEIEALLGGAEYYVKFSKTDSEDEEFPYPCPAGTYARLGIVEDQLRPSCFERCPAGSFCPEAAFRKYPCWRGHYCPRGALSPTACIAGTYSSSTKLKTAKGCLSVKPGYYSPSGAEAPTACPTAGYTCPGRAKDFNNTPPGSQPVLLGTGGTNFTVVKQLNLSASKLSFTLPADASGNASAFRTSLAQHFEVRPSSPSSPGPHARPHPDPSPTLTQPRAWPTLTPTPSVSPTPTVHTRCPSSTSSSMATARRTTTAARRPARRRRRVG